MKINFSLKPSKKGKDGKCPINIDFYVEGKRVIIFSGERCTPGKATWNGERVIGKEPFKEDINSRLDAMALKLQNIETDAIRDNIKLTPDYVKAKFKEKETPSDLSPKVVVEVKDDFFELLDKFIKDSEKGIRKTKKGKRITEGTIKIYKLTRTCLEKFVEKKGYHLTFKTINQTFYNSFCNFLWDDLKHYDNNVGKTIKTLKTFLTWSERTKEHTRPYFMGYSEDKDIVVFTPEQLNFLIDHKIDYETVISTYKLNNWPIEPETIGETAGMLERTKDILVMGCTTTLRVSDLLKLTKDNLVIGNNIKLNVYTSKTSKPVLIDLPPYAEEIVKKYMDKQSTLLPTISTQKFNDNLKTLGKFLGLDSVKVTVKRTKRHEPVFKTVPFSSLLTSHVMRRTGITTLLIAGMNEYAVRKLSGHSKNSKSFVKYIEFSQQYINMELQTAWSNIRSRGYGNSFMKVG